MQMKMPGISKLSILAIRATHHAILLFVVFGWMFAQQEILIAHMITIPFVILQWKMNEGRCLLTDLENHFLSEREDSESDGFVKGLIHKIFKVQPTENQVLGLMYAVMMISFLISCTKFFVF